jgi:hypothetical protein
MLRTVLAAIVLALAASFASADEGMWTPRQLPEISDELVEAGLRLDPEALSDLTGFPMGAVVSLGGCSGSFVSRFGLVVTNHHCVRGSVQYNSTPENNYLENGFLAQGLSGELPAAPGTRVYVTVDVKDVTARMREGLDEMLRGRDVHDAVESRRKALVAECETRPGHRCQVAAFHGGLEYRLIDRLEIRDVRLVYAPSESIGKYGGDVDNWMWPRHTGDFAFYRAYVAPDGRPADYAPGNVPFEPEHFLSVSKSGLEAGRFVMAAGYPGSTQRYARLPEVRNVFEWLYPEWVDLAGQWIATIEQNAAAGSDARLKYESRLAGLNNYLKNRRGQIEGARRAGLVERRAEREAALREWIGTQPDPETYLQALNALDLLSEQIAASERQAFWYNQARRPQLLAAARRLYRLALEREKPDAERKPGYQERDLTFIRQSMEAIERRYDPAVDRAEWLMFLENYVDQPRAARVAPFDERLGLGEEFDRAATKATLDYFYAETDLDELDTRLALMSASAEELRESDDPFMQLAVAISDHDLERERTREELDGRMLRLRPAYMQAIIDWQRAQGSAAYPDANSTLRVTYGNVTGGSPAADVEYEPFTTLEGIAEKHTGEPPFNAPQRQLDLIEAQEYGDYALESLASVPVNFLSDLDSTGGNSGSATLNSRGELVGLLFDGTLESVNSDWHFDSRATRTIHVDTRYMLWVMEKVDGATALIGEMRLVE